MRPAGPFRMPRAGRDGVLCRRGAALARLLHFGDEPITVRAWPVAGAVRISASAATPVAAAYGVERMRFALALDFDPAPIRRRFARDPLLGPIVRRRAWLRPKRHADPFQALVWAISEQLIEAQRAFAIQRRMVWRWGRRSGCGTLRDVPAPSALAARAPAELEACDLSTRRALATVRAAREVAAGRVDLGRHEESWRRLRAVPSIGSWTVECLAVHGQGRDDQLPAGDLAYVKLVGRLRGLGRRATEGEVREFFAPYAPHQALAAMYLVSGAAESGLVAGRPPAPWHPRVG